MIQSRFQQYKLLKASFTFTKSGISYANVLAPAFITLIFEPEKFNKLTYKDIFRNACETLDVTQLKALFLQNKNVCTCINTRNDYLELLNAYLKDVSNVSAPFLIKQLAKKKVLNIGNIITAALYMLRYKGSLTSFKQRAYLASYLIYNLNVSNALHKAFKNVDVNNKGYIPFNSAYNIEALFVQFFKLRGCNTYHVSHGLSYVQYKLDLAYDIVNGENITAQKVLVWGNSSKSDLIENYQVEDDRIFVAGNPLYADREINVNQHFKKCVVFLGRSVYDEYNVKLLTILGNVKRQTGIDFYIKAHPLSNILLFTEYCNNYKLSLLAKEDSIQSLLSSGFYDFAIAFNTTSYYQAMYYNLVCLRFGQCENEQYLGLDDKFFDELTLIDAIEKFKQMNVAEINKQIANLLHYCLGMGINNYSKIICN